MKITIIGSTGQLGTDLMKTLQTEHETIGLTHKDIEVTDYSSCAKLQEQDPDIIINTAAFHKTDQCEDDPIKTFSVNALGARNIALISKEIGATAVFISTDYVFDGTKNEPYTEDDNPNPINTYGISKLAGELFTKQNINHYIIRVASLFGTAGASGKGGNFVEKVINSAKKGEALRVINDVWMSPTYTRDAASAIQRITERKLPFGTYHTANSGHCTWFEFATEIFSTLGLTPSLMPISVNRLQMKARRPRFSVLNSSKLRDYNIETRDWKQAIHDYLSEKGHMH